MSRPGSGTGHVLVIAIVALAVVLVFQAAFR